jgi:serine/threonine protein kinase
MEYVPNSLRLLEYVGRNLRQNPRELAEVSRQVVEGLSTFSEHNIAHFDAHTENVLINAKTRTVKFIDYDLEELAPFTSVADAHKTNLTNAKRLVKDIFKIGLKPVSYRSIERNISTARGFEELLRIISEIPGLKR